MDFTLDQGETRPSSPGRLMDFYLQTCADMKKERNPYIEEVTRQTDHLPPGTMYGGFTLTLNGNTRLFPNHKLTDDDIAVLVHVLHRNTYITGVNLQYNNLTNCAAEMIGKLLLESSSITDLNLMCNDIGSHGAKWLSKALQFNRSVKNLRMNGNKIGNTGGMHFATMLQLNRTLESLDLGDCDLETQSLIALATVLHHNKTLRAIDVGRPIIHTIQQICDKLVLNHSLRLLDLHCNQISSDGAKSLAELLKRNTPLKILDLAANRIEDDGLVFISDALRYRNDQLLALSVARNNISGIGLMALANALKSNNTLTNVYVWGNNFDESASIDFANLIKAGRLKPKRTDISPYWIDGRVYLSELAHGLQMYYYWTPLYGDRDEAACNANTYLLKEPNTSISQIDIEESIDTSSFEGDQPF
ncbi:hypothetical protein chiPu_0006431 [Chiloscyllium punctatum]|uniref:Leucine-rich repeat-containing protein 34 n=1 Tax=Chiloscyllium punctatum TaxID=137246 RepID=A0A401SC91_CHIPU|nr:hypothetical protein [Chiloscyllium punctatum]